MTPHVVPLEVFDRLAEGEGGTSGVLYAGRRSKRLLLLHEMVTTALSQEPSLCAEARTTEAYAVLADAHRRDRGAVDNVLLQPTVGAWATACLRRLVNGDPLPPYDIGHLGGLAAAAALRAGLAFEVTACGRDGWLMLPTLGLARLPGGAGWCRLRSRPGAGGIAVSTGDAWSTIHFSATAADDAWRPLRRLRSSAGAITLDVVLDDVDPYRDCEQLPIADRLMAGEVQEWRQKLDEAWSLLVSDHRGQAEAIADGIVTIVPLRPTAGATELSATCHEAGGALATTPPRRALSLALALVHEFQHTKLSALLDLVPLLDDAPERNLYAPWRADPRPLRGLLQGTYAFLGLAGFWGVHRAHRGPSELEAADDWAHFEFALVRSQVEQALVTLRKSRHVRLLGHRFVEGMTRRLSGVDREDVPRRLRSLARWAVRDHMTSWRLRNLRPNADQVATLAEAWLGGRPCPWPSQLLSDLVDGGGPIPSAARLALLRQRLAFPSRWHHDVGDATTADVHVVGGDPDQARTAYLTRLAEDPDDLPSWSGLALAHRDSPSGATRALAFFPERVHAVHQAIRARTGTAPTPEALASWIAGT